MRKKVAIITLQNPIPRTYFSSIHQNNEGKGIRYSDDLYCSESKQRPRVFAIRLEISEYIYHNIFECYDCRQNQLRSGLQNGNDDCGPPKQQEICRQDVGKSVTTGKLSMIGSKFATI